MGYNFRTKKDIVNKDISFIASVQTMESVSCKWTIFEDLCRVILYRKELIKFD